MLDSEPYVYTYSVKNCINIVLDVCNNWYGAFSKEIAGI